MSKHNAQMALEMKNAHMKKAGFTMKLMLFINDLPPFKAWILCRVDQMLWFYPGIIVMIIIHLNQYNPTMSNPCNSLCRRSVIRFFSDYIFALLHVLENEKNIFCTCTLIFLFSAHTIRPSIYQCFLSIL